MLDSRTAAQAQKAAAASGFNKMLYIFILQILIFSLLETTHAVTADGIPTATYEDATTIACELAGEHSARWSVGEGSQESPEKVSKDFDSAHLMRSLASNTTNSSNDAICSFVAATNVEDIYSEWFALEPAAPPPTLARRNGPA